MFTYLIAKFGFAFGCILALLAVALTFSISWIVTCGIVYLIMMCFALEFSWTIATGVWLVMFLLGSIFSRG